MSQAKIKRLSAIIRDLAGDQHTERAKLLTEEAAAIFAEIESDYMAKPGRLTSWVLYIVVV